jgi:hypothetical protein|tara:strand:+ start:9491 stop:9724 length:234 start_codon:yes stop_codon:yes gene_type:complete
LILYTYQTAEELRMRTARITTTQVTQAHLEAYIVIPDNVDDNDIEEYIGQREIEWEVVDEYFDNNGFSVEEIGGSHG